jgi:hypothetical protein
MLNLYAVTVWHSSDPRHYETFEVRTYTASRAQHLARESFPSCRAIAELVHDCGDSNSAAYSSPSGGVDSERRPDGWA